MALMQQGHDQQKAGNLEGAYDAFREAALRDPGNRDAVLQRDATRQALARRYEREATQAFQRQNLDVAIAKWDRVLALEPDQPEGEARARARDRPAQEDEREVRRERSDRRRKRSDSAAARASLRGACGRPVIWSSFAFASCASFSFAAACAFAGSKRTLASKSVIACPRSVRYARMPFSKYSSDSSPAQRRHPRRPRAAGSPRSATACS